MINRRADIESTKVLLSYSYEKQTVFDNICKVNKLSEAFITEFSQYITLENFSTSYRLEKSLADMYPEYFSESIFLKSISDFYEREDKLRKEQEEENNNSSSAASMLNALSSLATATATTNPNGSVTIEDEEIPIDNYNISISMLSAYLEELKKNELINIPSLVLNTIRKALPEEFNSEDVLGLVGINEKIDKAIMLSVTDPTTKNSLLLVLSLNEGMKVSSTVSSNYTDEMRENLLGNECDSKEFITALTGSKNLLWQEEKINDALSGNIKINTSYEQFDNLLASYLTKIPEDLICKIFKLRDYMPNAFSSKMLMYILSYKKLSEEQLIQLISVYQKSGAILTLQKYATDNEYTKLDEEIRRSFGK